MCMWHSFVIEPSFANPKIVTDPGVDLGIGYGIPVGGGFEIEIGSGLAWNAVSDFQAVLSGPLAVPMAFDGPPIPGYPGFDTRYQYPITNTTDPANPFYEPKYPEIAGGPQTAWWPGATGALRR